MKAVRPVLASKGFSYLQMTSVGSNSRSIREKKEKKKKEKGITISDTRIGERNRNIKKYKNNHNCFVSCIFFGLFLFSWANNCPCKVICLYN